ncbi:DUF5073 family protein [Mycolicibacterium sp. CBMA 226]|uniref:DUF5073 family protein n=1 Tax=Mycolicibacterium sp. CBMA 226 TaxID=2606611 RepID=UPI0012DCE615|nr:DUF5073 family protein [Mycolicibacterium sp. CBMA 226]MUL76507.1 DUF5073 domain-containing protein [Mycolicibacterium sp. CBMA 226]
MTEFDSTRVSDTVSAALAGPAGIAAVVNVFRAVPGVVHTPGRRGMFRSAPERVQIGDWRYEVAADGRLKAAHVVNDIVIAEDLLDAGIVGPHLARALSQLVARHGPTICPHIDAAVDVLAMNLG